MEVFGGALSIALCAFGGITIMLGIFSMFTKKLRIAVFILYCSYNRYFADDRLPCFGCLYYKLFSGLSKYH